VAAGRLEQREGADEVRAQERGGVAEGVVVVGLRGEVHDRVALAGERPDQLLDQRGVGDVADDQAHPVLGETGEGGGGAGVGEAVQHRHARVGAGEDVVDEVRADEAGAAGDQQVGGHQRVPPGVVSRSRTSSR
jgi:hypothetical protein